MSEKLIKKFASIKNVKDELEELDDRTFKFVFSTSNKDRDQEVLKADNWKLDNFNNNPIVGYMHNVYGNHWGSSNPDDIIGKAKAYVEDGKLVGEITFEPKEVNELAEKVYQKVKFGSLSTVSVGFMPFGKGYYGEGEESKGEKNETFYYEGQELLEISIVNIPANPEAVRQRALEMENEFVKKLDLIKNELKEELEKELNKTDEELLERVRKAVQEEYDLREYYKNIKNWRQ